MSQFFVRLKRRSRLPYPIEDTEAIFAAADGTLKHMDPDGNVEDLAGGGGGGGSQTVEAINLPIAFDDAGITSTGVDMGYTTQVGDVILAMAISVTTAWDGTAPYGSPRIGSNEPYNGEGLMATDLSVADSSIGAGGASAAGSQVSVVVVTQGGALTFKVFNNDAGGDPGSSQGEGRVSALILKAS